LKTIESSLGCQFQFGIPVSLQKDLEKLRQQYQEKNALLNQQETKLKDAEEEQDQLNEQIKQFQLEVSSQRSLSHEKSYQIKIVNALRCFYHFKLLKMAFYL